MHYMHSVDNVRNNLVLHDSKAVYYKENAKRKKILNIKSVEIEWRQISFICVAV